MRPACSCDVTHVGNVNMLLSLLRMETYFDISYITFTCELKYLPLYLCRVPALLAASSQTAKYASWFSFFFSFNHNHGLGCLPGSITHRRPSSSKGLRLKQWKSFHGFFGSPSTLQRSQRWPRHFYFHAQGELIQPAQQVRFSLRGLMRTQKSSSWGKLSPVTPLLREEDKKKAHKKEKKR